MTKEFISRFLLPVGKKRTGENKKSLKVGAYSISKKNPHIFGDLQHGQNKEDVFVSVEQQLVLEVSVHLGVSEGELGRQLFEEGGDVGFRLSLSSETHTSTCSVYLSQKLMIEERRRCES